MCSRHCELRGGNKCGAEEEARWLLVRCQQRITRADPLALSDRSFRISSKQDKVCAILYFEEGHMDLFVSEYGNCWFEIRQCLFPLN